MHIGLVGYIRAGKGEVSRILHEVYQFTPLSFGDIVRNEARSQGISLTRENLQDLGHLMTKQAGEDYWARRVHECMAPESQHVIDGFRYPGQVRYFQEIFGDNFVLAHVVASDGVRLKRVMASSKGPVWASDFIQMDKRDRGEEDGLEGQQTAACARMCRYTILNEGTLDELKTNVARFMTQIGKA